MNIFNNLKASFSNSLYNKIIYFLSLIVFSFLLFNLLFSTFQGWFISNKSERLAYLHKLNASDSVITYAVNKATITKCISIKQINTIKNQYSYLSKRKIFYISYVIQLVSNYWASVNMIMISTVLAAIALFYITSKGWANTDGYIRVTFLFLIFVAGYWGLWPSVFDQKANISRSLKTYKLIDSLQITLYAHLGKEGITSDSCLKETDKLIIGTNKTISQNNDLNFNIEESKISDINIKSMLPKTGS